MRGIGSQMDLLLILPYNLRRIHWGKTRTKPNFPIFSPAQSEFATADLVLQLMISLLHSPAAISTQEQLSNFMVSKYVMPSGTMPVLWVTPPAMTDQPSMPLANTISKSLEAMISVRPYYLQLLCYDYKWKLLQCNTQYLIFRPIKILCHADVFVVSGIYKTYRCIVQTRHAQAKHDTVGLLLGLPIEAVIQ